MRKTSTAREKIFIYTPGCRACEAERGPRRRNDPALAHTHPMEYPKTRTNLGLTQEAFASAILTSQARVNAWECCVNVPSAAYIGRMWTLARQHGYLPTWWYDETAQQEGQNNNDDER